MEGLLNYVREFAEDEKVPAKLVAALLLQFTANDEKDYSVSNVCRDILESGTYAHTTRELRPFQCPFLLDFLNLGRRKYNELRRFLDFSEFFC